jgi:hypothetical protein
MNGHAGVVEQLEVTDKVFGSVGAAAVLVPEHLVLGAEHFAAEGAGGRGGDVNVGDVRSQLPEGLVADVADPAVAGRVAPGSRSQASSTRISSG